MPERSLAQEYPLNQEYFYLVAALRGLSQKIEDGTEPRAPLEELVMANLVRNVPGGVPTFTNSQGETSPRSDAFATTLRANTPVIARGHAQLDANTLSHPDHRVIERDKGTIKVDVTPKSLTYAQVLHMFAMTNGSHCAAQGGGHGSQGGMSSLYGSQLAINQIIGRFARDYARERTGYEGVAVSDLERARDEVRYYLENGLLDVGVELPGGLVIRPDMNQPGSYTIGPDLSSFTRAGLIELSAAQMEQDRRAVRWSCVDERVSLSSRNTQVALLGDQLVFANEHNLQKPGDIGPHAPVVIGILDSKSAHDRALGVALRRLNLVNIASGEPHHHGVALRLLTPLSEDAIRATATGSVNLRKILLGDAATWGRTHAVTLNSPINDNTMVLPAPFMPNDNFSRPLLPFVVSAETLATYPDLSRLGKKNMMIV